MTIMTQIWILMMIGSKEEMDETNCVEHLKINKKERRLHLYLLVPFTPSFGSNFYHCP